ncbi:septation protein A [Erythrobacter sp. HI0019]|jgi:intracellular septation protein|uniref:inner membrane-spanning protein YciB n=1 Tax=unclassified Erythrobacter TaxID=2633097 RepID=UPI0007BA4139|nr:MULTISPECIES: inner membrane-spanning protein YciB [unclassified Erythrobacter]RZP19805.1 MAG: septation protein IspZ [Erythrobacter sp.]KZX93280.1 septation protein A [Erythrobacter sp. HI0019]KZX93305.1 septation protein A [Erythrobacter sp. HI0019]KZY00569.1 septation protein A [Erythrobacter sp. HI0028]KZY92127.1 septation protein A [Erythrobacter sp. HI0074]|tara:strand:+ start:5582 stop:6229 length:648 start_codon:yes stop_codon:yes gene_type:complete
MTESAKPKPKTGWLNILVDYGPLLVFLGVYKFYQPPETSTFGEIAAVIYGTIAFMIAAVAALVFSKFKFGHVSPMLILSTALIVGFGGLTIWLQDEKFIQIKPTAIYLLFGVLLIGGWLRGKALLQILLEAAFEGVDRDGWLKLSRNWGVFFVFMAGLNEVLRLQLDFESWLWAKLWVFMPLSFLFTFSQIPMLLKHGLAIEDRDEVVKDEPPTA